MTRVAYVALGSNLGDREAAFRLAVAELAATPGVRLSAMTEPVETAPLGGMDQPMYLNAMVRLEVTLTGPELLTVCQAIECRAGRQPHTRWAPRELDLDIVEIVGLESDDPHLMLPHPGLATRPFWARQLAELEGVIHD